MAEDFSQLPIRQFTRSRLKMPWRKFFLSCLFGSSPGQISDNGCWLLVFSQLPIRQFTTNVAKLMLPLSQLPIRQFTSCRRPALQLDAAISCLFGSSRPSLHPSSSRHYFSCLFGSSPPHRFSSPVQRRSFLSCLFGSSLDLHSTTNPCPQSFPPASALPTLFTPFASH